MSVTPFPSPAHIAAPIPTSCPRPRPSASLPPCPPLPTLAHPCLPLPALLLPNPCTYKHQLAAESIRLREELERQAKKADQERVSVRRMETLNHMTRRLEKRIEREMDVTGQIGRAPASSALELIRARERGERAEQGGGRGKESLDTTKTGVRGSTTRESMVAAVTRTSPPRTTAS